MQKRYNSVVDHIIDGYVVHISHTCRCEEVFYHIFTMISYSRLID